MIREKPLVCLIILLLGSLFLQCHPSPRRASILFVHGKIYTVDSHRPMVEALAIVDDRIGGLGTTKELADRFVADTVIDLAGRPAYPGFIDAHVHLDWHFGLDGRYATRDSATLTMACAAENAFATLMAGFTTVQSVGANLDKELRDVIAEAHLDQPEGRRWLNEPGIRAVDATAERIARLVDELLGKQEVVIRTWPPSGVRAMHSS